MNRPCLICGLRIAWSVWWGLIAVFWIAWWGRSFSVIDCINLNIPGKNEIQLFTMNGSFAIGHQDTNLGWFWLSPRTWFADTEMDNEYPGPHQFQYTHVTGCSTLRMPYWFLT